MGCAASRDGHSKHNKPDYWFDREENLITVNFTDSEPESKASDLISECWSDFESCAMETLPNDIPSKAAKMLLDPENRIDSGIWVDNISMAEYDPDDYPVFSDNSEFRTRSQSLNERQSSKQKHKKPFSSACDLVEEKCTDNQQRGSEQVKKEFQQNLTKSTRTKSQNNDRNIDLNANHQ